MFKTEVISKRRVRKIRFWWHLISAFFSKYKLRISICAAGFITLCFFLARIESYFFNFNIVSIGYIGNYTLDNIPSPILSLVTRSLITTDESGKPIPQLASNWTVSDDGKTYVVFLKDNLFWHDGTQVIAKDITLSISNVKVTALNNKAIQFELPNAISSFPNALDKPVFKSNSFYGTGEFRIVKIDKVGDIVKRINLHPKNKDLPDVEIKFYSSEEEATNALKIGEIKSLSTTTASSIMSWPNLEVTKTPDTSEVVSVFYNTSDQNLSTKETRQALSYAINKSNFEGQAAYGPISQKSWAYSEETKRYEYNTAKAKELLSKANIKDPQITLSYVAGLDNLAKQIKQDWENAGVSVALKKERGIPDNFQALLALSKLPADPDQYGMWHSTQTKTNITHYKSLKVDKLLEDARGTSDESKRRDLYAEFQKDLVDDAPITFLYYPYKYNAVYKNAKNLISKLK